MRMSDWSADVCSSDLDLCDALEAGGPYGAGWPAPRVAAGPVRIVKADVVGNGHLRLIVAGDDGRRIKAIAFRMAESALGQAMLAAPPPRTLWIAGRVKRDDGGDQIGRASCRERGCQYVWLREGGGSLKKN